MEQPYEREVTCTLCGAKFIVTSKYSRAKRCPDCRRIIDSDRQAYNKAVMIEEAARRDRSMARLDKLAREARAHGLSYGQYVAMLKAQQAG